MGRIGATASTSTFKKYPWNIASRCLLPYVLLTVANVFIAVCTPAAVIQQSESKHTRCEVVEIERRSCAPAWHDAKFSTEYAILDAVYGKIFGGEAIDFVYDKIPEWANIKADELSSNIPFKENDIVLDVGCGPGFIAAAVRERVPKGSVICFDVNKDMNDYARSKHGSYLRYELIDAARNSSVVTRPLDSFPDNSLDIFYSFAVFIHHDMYVFTSYLEGLSQKLKLGGHVYLQYLPGENFYPNDPTFREHYNLWSKDPAFWVMAMHYNSREGVLRLAAMCGFEEVERKGHSGVLHPSMVGQKFRAASQMDGNILFKKTRQVALTATGCV